MPSIGREPRRVLDLYSGGGLFTVPLAAAGHRLTAVEENAQAVSDAAKNLELNGIAPRSVRLVRARVEDALRELARPPIDVVILDPPRQGCPREVIDAVFVGLRPARAIYVSCHPESFAAELPTILGAGYRVARVQPVDMFPHTPHVEAAVVLDRMTPAPVAARPRSAKSVNMPRSR